MKIKIVRQPSIGMATIGKMYINDIFFAHTLEDLVRNQNGDCSKKVQNQTAIDFGTYTVILSFSNHFQKELPEILNVKCFAGVRIHGGNAPADTEGCVLIGSETDEKTKIWNCAPMVSSLIQKIKGLPKGEVVTLEITK